MRGSTGKDVPVIYIGGMGRSGSTVLASELARCDDAVSVGELRYLWERGVTDNHLCGCGQPFQECPFWTDVLKEAYGDDVDVWRSQVLRSSVVDRIRHIPALSARPLRTGSFRADHRTYADAMVRLYRAIHDVSGGKTIIDSSKDPSYAFALQSVSGIELRLLHLIRDSRAVAYSWTRRKIRPEIHWQVEYMNTRPPMLSARRWVQYNAIFEFFGRCVGPATRLRYEDFAAAPEATIAQIVRGSDGMLTDTATSTPFRHSISGNPVRFLEQPEPIKVDDAWRTEMSRTMRLAVTAISTPLLTAYRYPLVQSA